jgi:HSP20 family molecular chaperone IbpA
MKLIKNKKFLKEIANQIDLLNTLGGGISLPQVNDDKLEKGMVIRVAIPGVTPESYRIALSQNNLTVMATFRPDTEAELVAPLFQQVFMLPPAVDLSRIDAVFEGQELQVRLPYHLSTYQTRQIDIQLRD